MIAAFDERVKQLPQLGIGVSTEYGALSAPGGLDIAALAAQHPQFAGFLEVGLEIEKGLDAATHAWIQTGKPTTLHFLDINLDEPEDFDPAWCEALVTAAKTLDPAWICGDAGLWHFGPRERGHMLLLPPILCEEAAQQMAEGIVRLRELTGYEVLPENPPGHVYLGDMHLLEFFSRVCQLADTGMLLDVAHLAIYQDVMGHDPLDGLADFDCRRVVEMHVAGASFKTVEGLTLVEDDHTPNVLPPTWTAFETVAARAEHLKAVVFECERNPLAECLPGYTRIESIMAGRS